MIQKRLIILTVKTYILKLTSDSCYGQQHYFKCPIKRRIQIVNVIVHGTSVD